MKLELKNFQTLELDGNAVLLAGQNGSLKIANQGTHIYTIRYIPDGEMSRGPETELEDELYAEEYRPLSRGCKSWGGIEETDREYILQDGDARLEILKGTGVVTAFWKSKIAFGGPIGTPDTVLPRYPLRIQNSGTGTGKFNFCASADDIFLGLGEKSGKLDKNRRRFKMFNRDALGYEAKSSDPLYKSIPFFLQVNRSKGSVAGVYFPHPSIDEVDFRVESNYYTYIKVEGPPYGYVIFLGDDYRDILDSYTRYSGRPALPPRFSFGYIGSSMSYVEPDDAMQRVEFFFDEVERRGIPCEGMYLSSGYAKADNGERYTFIWNSRKFPDPKAFMERIGKRGYRICCNIKPGILSTHPDYHEMENAKRFVADASGDPCLEYYWGNTASFVDFSRPDVREWWKEQLKKNFIRLGVEGIWNDNNEFELEDTSVPLYRERSILTLLMLRCSQEALCEERPGRRPWVVSRSGYAGMQRYARTWTGDNVSNEESLVSCFAMGMNLGLSGVPFYGHDIGGFFGNSPSPELLFRWSQAAVFQPRFVMHSWNSNGRPTEPWTYPDRFETIRNLIRLRYRFLPYIYSTAFSAAMYGTPMERPLWLDFEDDPSLPQDLDVHMVGDSLLVVPPLSVASHIVEWRFPAGTTWVSGNAVVRPDSSIPGEKGIGAGLSLYRGGEAVRMAYPDDDPLFFFRTGGVVPENSVANKMPDGYSEQLELSVIPVAGKADCARGPSVVFEDDGVSTVAGDSYCVYEIRQELMADGTVLVTVEQKVFAANAPDEREIRISVPAGFSVLPRGRSSAWPSRTADTFLSRSVPIRQFMINGTYGSLAEP